MVLPCTAGPMVHQVCVCVLAVHILTHSLQETWQPTLPHLQLILCGSMSVLCAALSQCWTSSYWSSASACHRVMWQCRYLYRDWLRARA